MVSFLLFANITLNTPGVLGPSPPRELKKFASIVSSIKALSSLLKIPVIAFDIVCC